jgi:transcription antitermination factor NusG
MDEIIGYWTVAQTEPMREAVAVSHLERAGYTTYLPRIKSTKRVVPLFPTYAFVRITDHWYSAMATIGVIRLLLDADRPARVGDEVIHKIKAQERGGLVKLAAPRPRFIQGDKVRIVRGNFLGHLGIYDGMTGKERERILLDLLGRKVQVELPRTDIQPLEVVN